MRFNKTKLIRNGPKPITYKMLLQSIITNYTIAALRFVTPNNKSELSS